MSPNDRFTEEASTWDSNPAVQTASKLGLAALLQNLPQLSDNFSNLDVLELGCGTGILSLLISPYVKTLCAVDISSGMIEALQLKLSSQPKVTNIQPVCAFLEDADDERIAFTDKDDKGPRRFDLAISHLVLHHIPDLKGALSCLFACLKSGGMCALTDFENVSEESRKFHPEEKMDGVERHGIERGMIEGLMKEVGFVNVRIQTAFEMEKDVEIVAGGGLVEGNTEINVFPFLICMGVKP